MQSLDLMALTNSRDARWPSAVIICNTRRCPVTSGLAERQALCVKWIGRASPSHSFDEVDASVNVQGGPDASALSTLADVSALLGEDSDEMDMDVEELAVNATEV